MAKIKIVHIITGLERAGAEMMLYKLLSAMSSTNFSSVVISLTDKGPVAPLIASLGIPVQNLGMRRGKFSISKVFELASRLKKFKPDIVQTWMYHADVIGGIAALFSGKAIVAWNVRNGSLDLDRMKDNTMGYKIGLIAFSLRPSKNSDVLSKSPNHTRKYGLS